MASSYSRTGGAPRILLIACVLGGLVGGCTAVGPSAIRSGRLTYNDAITRTNNEQILMAVIRNRYEEQGSLLAVASVTANVHVSTGTAVQLGFGDSDNYAGNLVPFSARAVYEENPTISYIPVAGQKYLRQVTAPLPIAVLAQLAETFIDPAPIYTMLVSSVNDIYNPDFMFSSAEPDPRFNRLVTIMAELTRAHRLHWVEDPARTNRFSIVIDHYKPHYAGKVDELLRLLGLPARGDASPRLVLPVFEGLDTGKPAGISVTTRSVYRLVEILSAAVELPEQDRGSNAAADYPPRGPAGEQLRVRVAKARPDRAAVAVPYRNVWFYIDDRDRATKGFFRLLGSLWSVAVAEGTAGSTAAPVLTVPASR